MKHLGKLLCLPLCLCFAFAGCSTREAAADTLTIIGSSSVERLAGALGDQFVQAHPNATVNVQAPGSSAGIKAVYDGTADIGTSSRALKATEEQWGLTPTVLALDGIAIIVHPSNPIGNLSREQLAAIYRGEIRNWREVGGEDLGIQILTREAGSGTRDAFEGLVGLLDHQKSQVDESIAVFGDGTNVISTYTKGMRNAIGYVSLGSLQAGTKPITIDHVACTYDTVRDGSYPVARSFILLLPPNPTALAQSYIDFARSKAGSAIVQEEGFVPPEQSEGENAS